jgi:hypothetical protein
MRLDVRASDQEKRLSAVAADANYLAMKNLTPAQIDAWVDANIVADASVRRALKLLAKAVVLLLWERTG